MSKTHFGYQSVDEAEKAGKVAEVFHSVASKYDVMNDLMSFGLHRLWKKVTIARAQVRPGQKVLDIAGGTGDLAAAFARALVSVTFRGTCRPAASGLLSLRAHCLCAGRVTVLATLGAFEGHRLFGGSHVQVWLVRSRRRCVQLPGPFSRSLP